MGGIFSLIALGQLMGWVWVNRSQGRWAQRSSLAKRLVKFQLRRSIEVRSQATGLAALRASIQHIRILLNDRIHPIWLHMSGALSLAILGLLAACFSRGSLALDLASALFGLSAFMAASLLAGRFHAMTQWAAASGRRDLLRSEDLQIGRLQLAANDLQQRSDLKKAQRTALRHQMNPHFIFNTLNGICADVLAGRTLRGRSYLTAFRELVTAVMRQAEAGWIAIDDEVGTLKRYVEIESLRLDQFIEFQCPPPGEYEVSIPSLLLQPLVENALWHGLRFLPQGVPAELSLTIRRLEFNRIEIQIRDNGMPESLPETADTPDGVAHAQPQVNVSDEKNARRHASDIIRDRLQLLDSTGQCGLEITQTLEGTVSRVVLPTRNV